MNKGNFLLMVIVLLGLLCASGTASAQTNTSNTVVAWGYNDHGQATVPAGLSGVTAVAGGYSHSLVLEADGTVVAWGWNHYGQSSVPAGLSGVTAIAAGYYHSLALKGDGTVVAWGWNHYGQSSVPAGLSGVVAIAAGYYHNLALKGDGTVVAWGYDGSGQATVPAGLTDVIAITAGVAHSLALKGDGSVVAWGNSEYGQSTLPAGLTDGTVAVIAIADGPYHSLALKSDGTVLAWGYSRYGEATVPAGLSDVVAIAAGYYYSLALKGDGSVVAWGYNASGQAAVPAGLSGVTAIAAGAYHSLAIVPDQDADGVPDASDNCRSMPNTNQLDADGDGVGNVCDNCPITTNADQLDASGDGVGDACQSSGTVVAWGANYNGQTGVPAGLTGFTAIDGGGYHSLALQSDGSVVAWGWNYYGQTTVPAGLNNVIAIAAGYAHSLALKGDGSVVAWGNDWYGQSTVPAGLSNVIAIAAGDDHSLALQSDGTVVAWGQNSDGQSSVPSGLSGVSALAAGAYHSLALKSDGTVVAWGSDGSGQATVPAGLTDGTVAVTGIAAGSIFNLALQSDGTVVAWGYDGSGQTTVPAGLSGVMAIAAGGAHSLALQNDGTVVAWGYDGFGQTTVPAGLSGVTAIAAGRYHSLALGPDQDGDGVPDATDNCPSIANADQADADADGVGDACEVAFPAPILAGISPMAAVAGSSGFILAVSGSDFVAGSTVRWNGADLTTTLVSTTQLTAIVPANKLLAVQTAQITVYTPAPGGGTSGVLAFFVTDVSAGVTGQDVSSGENPAATYGPATATGTGSGLVAVAQYDANPGGTPSFSASGTYFDVYAAPDSSFTQVLIQACGLSAGDKLYWWDAAADRWVKASPQSYDATTGCVTLAVDANSSPSLSQLAGTAFAVAINTAPLANPGGPYLGAINTALPFDGSASSDADGDPFSYAWTFGDGATGTGAMPTHAYAAAGVYKACLTVNDGSLSSDPACTMAVVYDPSAGFVTGGGWIISPAGAYKLDATLSGKATFGFVSKYQKGASLPTGNTEFQFEAGGFKFHSSAYDWLVVSKDKVTAQFKGAGTVNGVLDPNGNAYKFVLWAGDGVSANGADTFRIRIWWEDAGGGEHDVYDNGFNQEIGGGNIVVHVSK